MDGGKGPIKKGKSNFWRFSAAKNCLLHLSKAISGFLTATKCNKITITLTPSHHLMMLFDGKD